MKVPKKHLTKIKLALTSSLFVLAAALNYYYGVVEFPLWFLFLPGFTLATVFFRIYGSVIYTFFMGVFGLLAFYRTLTVEMSITYDEITAILYSFLLLIINLLLIGVLFSYQLDKLRREKEKAKEVVLVDQLTGLRNYGYFVSRLEEERRKADKEDYELSLIMIDIDHFKEFNDRFGHSRGNELLKEIAALIDSNVRSQDIVCRYGGEEFAIILPKTSLEEAFEIGERIRKEVEKAYFFGSKAFPRVKKTISCGVASYPGQAADEYELIDMADRALYFAKESGRNRTVAYSEEVELKWFKGFVEEF